MNRLRSVGTLVTVASALALSISAVAAQSAKDLVGAWTLVSADAFGSNPKGMLIFSADGHFASVLVRTDIAKYASNSRTQATPAESKATVDGTLAFFGTYTVSGTDLSLHLDGSTFPNWNGADQKRTNLTITGDELKYTQPTPSVGGAPAVVVWRRSK
jgi:hypothetical protein